MPTAGVLWCSALFSHKCRRERVSRAGLDPVPSSNLLGEVDLGEVLKAKVAERLNLGLFFRLQHELKLPDPELDDGEGRQKVR